MTDKIKKAEGIKRDEETRGVEVTIEDEEGETHKVGFDGKEWLEEDENGKPKFQKRLENEREVEPQVDVNEEREELTKFKGKKISSNLS